MEFKKGDIYGTHRVLEPKGVLPQPADVLDNTMEIYDNEVLIDVHTLNIDSASFTEIEKRAGGDVEEIKKIIMNIVETTGKHKNPAIRKQIFAVFFFLSCLSSFPQNKKTVCNCQNIKCKEDARDRHTDFFTCKARHKNKFHTARQRP